MFPIYGRGRHFSAEILCRTISFQLICLFPVTFAFRVSCDLNHSLAVRG